MGPTNLAVYAECDLGEGGTGSELDPVTDEGQDRRAVQDQELLPRSTLLLDHELGS